METKHGNEISPLKRLQQEPYRFTFFQAIRLFENKCCIDPTLPSPLSLSDLGKTALPRYEILRLRHKTSLSFPASQIYDFEPASFNQNTKRVTQPIITTSILGLTGATGALPQYYTDFILAQKRLGNTILIDFLGLFNHRLLSLYYRAWAKKCIFINYEKEQQLHSPDYYALITKSFHGNALNSTQENHSADLNGASVFYAGILSQQPRSALGLTRLLKSYLSLDISIQPWKGEWLPLKANDWTILSSSKTYNQLGKSALVGHKVWSVQNKFTIIIGPLNYQKFQDFIPTSSFFNKLKTLINYYIDNHLTYSIILLLKKEHVPKCRLNSKFQLGWNTWLLTKPSNVDKRDTCISSRLPTRFYYNTSY